MALFRERRHQTALRLSLPPTAPARISDEFWYHLPVNQLIRTLSDLEKLEVVGQGSSCSVYKVRHKMTGCMYALKVLRFGIGEYGAVANPAHAAEILTDANSDFLVRCYGLLHSAGKLCFVMEYMDEGSLHKLLQAQGCLREGVLSIVARCVLEGLKYLQGMQIVHRDIKPSNLLINSKGEVKIADFGVSTRVSVVDRVDSCEKNQGTWAYMSPERLDPEMQCDGGCGGGGSKGFAGDVWSLGVVLLECFLGKYPFIGVGQKPDWATLTCAICLSGTVELPETVSPEFRSFLRRGLEKDWRKRGTVQELLDHPFVTEGSLDCSEGLRHT